MTPCWPSPARRTGPAPQPADCASGHPQPKWPPTRAAIPATRSAAGMAGPAYPPLLTGGYLSQDKPAAAESGNPATPARLAALPEVANDAGATVNQVVPTRLTGAEVPVIPLTGASSAPQLDQSPAAADPELTTEQRTKLDAAR